MTLLLDDTELRLLLEKKKKYIGTGISFGIDSLFAGLTFLLSTFSATYQNFFEIPGNIIKNICFLIGILYTLGGLLMIVKSKTHNYTQENLYQEICDRNRIQHPFSLIAIQDTFRPYSNRFLLYYDKRWNCKFFFSYKTRKEKNGENIIKKLSHELKIDPSEISTQFLSERIQEKYSESDNIHKVYAHKLYLANIHSFHPLTMQDHFEIDGKDFYWMTISEMEQDERIVKINGDVVDFVKEMLP